MFNILSGYIQSGIIYKVIGSKSVVYNGFTYNTDDTFKGVIGVKTFEYQGVGSEMLTELTEIYAGGLIFEQTYEEKTFGYEATGITGMSINLSLTDEEKIVSETTELTGMSLTLLDYPFYSYFVNETRFSFNPD